MLMFSGLYHEKGNRISSNRPLKGISMIGIPLPCKKRTYNMQDISFGSPDPDDAYYVQLHCTAHAIKSRVSVCFNCLSKHYSTNWTKCASKMKCPQAGAFDFVACTALTVMLLEDIVHSSSSPFDFTVTPVSTCNCLQPTYIETQLFSRQLQLRVKMGYWCSAVICGSVVDVDLIFTSILPPTLQH